MNRYPQPPLDYEGSDLEALSTLRRYQNWIVGAFKPYLKGEAIEFGAGIGNISALIQTHVSTLDLVEPSVALAEPLRERFKKEPAVRIFSDKLEERLPAIEAKTYDCVILVNVLEHIEDDETALRGFLRILRPGGHLLLFVPALKFLFSDLDAIHGHFRRYTRPELNDRVEGAGFEIIVSRYFDTFGILPWWILNTVLGATSFQPFLAKVYDAVFAPLSRRLESIVTPPIGKNILLCSRRPEDGSG